MILNKEIGYYICDGKEFASKIAACVYGTQHNKEVKWMFNDEVFGRHDWTVEPVESLTSLYDKRARELRERYDYLVLSYSGGSDSHNILMSFIRQGLHLDELLINTFETANNITEVDPNNKNCWNYGAEYHLQIIPRLKEIANLIPKTKITVKDMSKFALDKLTVNEDPSWVLDQKEVLNPSGMSRYNYIHFSEIRKQFDKQKSIGLIVGVEKPTTYIKNGSFHVVFIDRSVNIAPVQIHFNEYDNTVIENFYWHPTCAKLIAKQAHTIKKWLLANPQYQPIWTYTTHETWVKNTALIHKLLRNVIYSDTWNNSWFQTDKGTKFWHDEIDQWFFDSYKDSAQYQNWERGVNWLKENAGNFLHPSEESLNPFVKIYYAGSMTG